MEKSKKKKYLIAGILLTICIMIGTSYAWWSSTATQSGINEIQSDCLSIAIEDEKDEIDLPYAYPLTDEEAEKLEPYTFTIANKCNTKVNYTVKLEELKTKGQADDKILKSEYVAIEVNNGQKQLLNEYPTITSSYTENDYESVEAKNIVNGTLEGNEKRNYQIKLWMDEHVTLQDDAMNKSFISKIVVDGGMNDIADYTEPILHGADPVLEGSSKPVAMLTANEISEVPTTTDKLIPVIIDDKGIVTKANIKEEWYNYEDKKWANAVILIDNAKEYQDGEKIPEDQIESYFVWIPKYKYKIFDMGHFNGLSADEYQEKSHEIDIKFGTENTTNTNESCATPGISGADGECAIDKWMTHPAFLAFEDSKGFWVGKFKTGYNQNDDSNNVTLNGNWQGAGAQKNEENPTKVIIKPNVYSWKEISVANIFKTSYEYQRDLDSHMMKNTEWGAVAYLSHSIYGTCAGGSCTEVRINNSSNSLTGVAAKEVPIDGVDDYKNLTSVFPNVANDKSSVYPNSEIASTTLNNTGIFDMSGGNWDYVAAAYTSATTSSELNIENIIYNTSKSELTVSDIKDSKYIDLYLQRNQNDYSKRILGDATGEMGPFGIKKYNTKDGRVSSWNEDYAWIIELQSITPFIARGAMSVYGTNAGVFAFVSRTGEANAANCFRIVLTP